jgi:hypothetical protein
MRNLTRMMGIPVTPAALNARMFWTNRASVRGGEPAAASLNGTRAGLGGRPGDRIGWGRLRSFASAERCGAAGLLNVVPAGQPVPFAPPVRGNHSRQHDDPRGGDHAGTVSRLPCCICVTSGAQVSGDRVGRHFHSHLSQN